MKRGSGLLGNNLTENHSHALTLTLQIWINFDEPIAKLSSTHMLLVFIDENFFFLGGGGLRVESEKRKRESKKKKKKKKCKETQAKQKQRNKFLYRKSF